MDKVLIKWVIAAIPVGFFIIKMLRHSKTAKEESGYKQIATIELKQENSTGLNIREGMPLLLECGDGFDIRLMAKSSMHPYPKVEIATISNADLYGKTKQRRSTATVLRIDGNVAAVGFRYV